MAPYKKKKTAPSKNKINTRTSLVKKSNPRKKNLADRTKKFFNSNI
jgi:hypothetical protein